MRRATRHRQGREPTVGRGRGSTLAAIGLAVMLLAGCSGSTDPDRSASSTPDAWYVFEPVGPQPATAPVTIVMHGYSPPT